MWTGISLEQKQGMGYRGIYTGGDHQHVCEMKTRWSRTDVNPKSVTKKQMYAPNRAILEAGVNRNHVGGNKEVSKRNFFRTTIRAQSGHTFFSASAYSFNWLFLFTVNEMLAICLVTG